ncbi:hypothetical protein DL766_001059 [Monosporascus sp. MC13-8B]|nr:hypothetical protein DL763_002070 [Monosporascus cannonballus]RYP38264.1 hypothetical protein DL766_001059 [Monosporascus sp. MC13-8B]
MLRPRDDSHWDSCRIRHSDSDGNESEEQCCKGDYQHDNPPVIPGISRPALLQGKRETDDAESEEKGARRARPRDPLPDSRRVLLVLGAEQEEDQTHYCETTDGEIDIETPPMLESVSPLLRSSSYSEQSAARPPPSDTVCESPANQRFHDGRDSENRAETPWKAGRFRRGISGSITTVSPVKRSAPPRLAMARPMMKAVEFGATPEKREQVSETRMLQRNILMWG